MPSPLGARFDVVSLDLDGTLIRPAIFNAVADALGFGAPLQKTYEAYLAGTLALEDAFHLDYAHFVGRRVSDLHRALLRSKAWTPGIEPALEDLHAAGLTVLVTTDQPEFLAEFTRRFGVDHLVCSHAELADGVVTARVRPAFAKWPNLRGWLSTEGVDPSRVVHVGNGRNDVPVFREVGYGLAVNAEHADVVRAAKASIPEVRDFREVSAHVLGVL